MRTILLAVAALLLAVPPSEAAKAKPVKKKAKPLLVCRRGCPYSTIQAAANAAKAGQTIRVKPGRYVEGVVLNGHAKDRITIRGLGTTPEETVIEGRGAKQAGTGNPAQNGVFADEADGVTVRNLALQNFPANGVLVRNAHGYTLDHLVATNNRAYGLYAFNSVGGRMSYSTASGSGDSGFYVGQTPPQEKPERTLVTNVTAFQNIIGYSGTNAKYVDVVRSEFFNNGAGVVPNTLSSEKFAPAADSLIANNLIYWNNLNYYRADSPVRPITTNEGNSGATSLINLPTAIGVLLLGTTNVTVRGNAIFGNFMWGVLAVSDPTYSPATTIDNKIRFNLMGAAFDDANGFDVVYDGSGRGNCFERNSPGTTFDQGGQPEAVEYPGCAAPNNVQDPVNGVKILNYFRQTEAQEQSWKKHPHPPQPDREPLPGG